MLQEHDTYMQWTWYQQFCKPIMQSDQDMDTVVGINFPPGFFSHVEVLTATKHHGEDENIPVSVYHPIKEEMWLLEDSRVCGTIQNFFNLHRSLQL